MKRRHLFWFSITTLLFTFNFTASAFEDARVLPSGVRRVSIRGVDANVIGKANQSGEVSPLSASLKKPLTFRDMAESRDGTEKAMLEGYLLAKKFDLNDAAGYFEADVKSRVSVIAPIFGFGITDKLTFGMAIPYYRAQSAVDVGFTYGEGGRRLVGQMQDEGRRQEASKVADGLNQAVPKLQAKLARSGFASVSSWKGEGVGDITLLAKYKALQHRKITVAAQSGFVLPTGRTDDPDNLSDVPFGDGSLDYFMGAMTDYQWSRSFMVNVTYKYSLQFTNEQEARIGSMDDPFTTKRARVKVDPGDRDYVDTSLQYSSRMGLLAGAGILRERRFQHRSLAGDDAALIGRLGEYAQFSQWRLGYSSVEAYLAGKALAPTSITLSLMQNMRSRNTAVTDRLELDLSVFF